jgi:hypothetical protein
MDITMIGLQNAGKTSLLRVLAVSLLPFWTIRVLGRCSCDEAKMTDCVQGGEFTVEYVNFRSGGASRRRHCFHNVHIRCFAQP